MTPPARVRARLLAAALALSLLPALAFADAPAPPIHPWKEAYARRLAREGMERRENRERQIQQALREWKAAQRARAKVTGRRARPAPPDLSPGSGVAEPTALRRLSRAVDGALFSPPANTIVNSRVADSPGSGQSETSIAAFGDVVVAAWNDGQGFQVGDSQGWAISSDGGVSWIDQGNFPHPALSAFTWTSDPVLAVNEKTGAFYFSALCDFRNAQSQNRAGVGVIKGRWNGVAMVWASPVIANDSPAVGGETPDKEWVVADSVSGRVYLSYTQFVSGFSRIMFQASADSGGTWSTPRQLSLNNAVENGFVQGSRPVVDGTGRLYVAYELIGQGFADFFRIVRSDNGGGTFTTPATAESLYTNFGTGAPGFNRPNAIDFCGVAVDRSYGPNRGRIYLSWAESINWLDEVFTLGFGGNKAEVEANNTAATATPVTLGQTIEGSIGQTGDVDFYSLTLAQGQHIVVAADSTQASAQSAFSLRLLAEDGATRLTFTDFDSGVNPTSQQPLGFPSGWMFTAPATGTYYIRVGALGAPGSYRLRTGAVHRGLERGRDQRDIFVGYSDDGATWSDPVPLNTDEPAGFDSFTPELAVAPDGGIYCTWYDYRDAAPATNGGQASVYMARSGDGGLTWTTLGAMTDTLSDWTAAISNILPNQGDYMSLAANSSYLWSFWSDARRGDPDAFMARTPIIPNGAQVSFLSVRLADRRVTMDWRTTPSDTLTMRLYRSQDLGAFQFVAVVQFDATGALSYADTALAPEHSYSYRLGRFTNGVELFYGQVRVFLPGAFPMRMGPPRPDPVVGNTFVADFSLAGDGPADLILFDVSGREVFRRTVILGKGPHTLTLPVTSGLKQGLYVLTLRQDGHNASTRVHLVR